MKKITRRTMIAAAGGAAALTMMPWSLSAEGGVLAKRIPSTGEALPVIGMGTWQTFNVGSDSKLRADRTKILEAFFELGGGLVDSSPMYGSSQAVVGHALKKLDRGTLFSADKIWTSEGDATRSQFAETAGLWGTKTFDLMQIHNLVAWKDHLAALREMKAQKKIRYIGITTSHGRRHAELEQIMKTEAIDFVQLTYNPVDREVEKRLLPLAKERGIAVIANRPFDGGALVDRVQRGTKLPAWAKEFDALNWPQALLKWTVSHPAVTCAIPATSQLAHMRENMGACRGRLATEAHRKKLAELLA